jgi:hypothetical protein
MFLHLKIKSPTLFKPLTLFIFIELYYFENKVSMRIEGSIFVKIDKR